MASSSEDINLPESLLKLPTERFNGQKDIETKWKKCQDLLLHHDQAIDKATTLSTQILSNYKLLGSIETWLDNMERNLHVVTHCVQAISSTRGKDLPRPPT